MTRKGKDGDETGGTPCHRDRFRQDLFETGSGNFSGRQRGEFVFDKDGEMVYHDWEPW